MNNQPFFENSGTKKKLTVNQLAHYLGISPKTIYGYTYRGIIPFEKVGPRLIRFDLEKIDQWILQNQKENFNGD